MLLALRGIFSGEKDAMRGEINTAAVNQSTQTKQ
jgi:hypothetical protein